MDLVCEETGTNEIQSFDVESVPDLNMQFYKPPIPTIFPAYAV
jgi:hypothetical protein